MRAVLEPFGGQTVTLENGIVNSDKYIGRRVTLGKLISEMGRVIKVVPTGSVSQSLKEEWMRKASKAMAVATTSAQNNLLKWCSVER